MGIPFFPCCLVQWIHRQMYKLLVATLWGKSGIERMGLTIPKCDIFGIVIFIVI
jgi:hypothetical protein